MKITAPFFAGCFLLTSALTPVNGAPADPANAPRPKLQIINGSSHPIDIFWLKADAERVANGSVEPGKDTVITTTLGHRFVVVGRQDKSEATVASAVPVQGFRFDPQGRNGVPSFYKQHVSANGFPIVASAKVNPYALKEAAYLVDMMLAKRPDVRAAMIKSGARLCIMAHDEYTTDLPEFVRLGAGQMPGYEGVSAKDYWDARARGLGGSESDPFCSCGEENVLSYSGDPYEKESILIHEFAHNIHLRGMLNVDPTFDTRLKAAYDGAMKAGLWKGKYASVNHHEYFAEGVQSWFDNNRVNDHDHNHVNTRALLLEYDPGLAAMCREVFGDTVLKYTKPATRLTGHMAGYDPAKAPKFVWPDRLMQAKAQIRAKAEARDKAANGDPLRETRTVVGWTVHISRALLAANAAATERALELLKMQLEEIIREVPAAAVTELKKVPLWFSPEYPEVNPRAEYHPGAGWLSANKRDPVMVKGVEFTNVRSFEAETRRMPNFALHELAHAYHDRVLPQGFGNEVIKAAYEKAKAGGTYDRVERQDSEGRKRLDRAYALSTAQEYFAETTEAFFSRNDFFPYTKAELKQHDPEMFALLGKLWTTPAAGSRRGQVKVFVLAGQSNMEGQAVVDLDGKNYNQGKGTLKALLADPAKAAMLRHLQTSDGKWTVRPDVWVRYQRESGPLLAGPLAVGFAVYGGAHHFGPELQFGHVLGDALDQQVLLLKTAWGGKSLFKDFRPPSSGGETGPYYTKMITEVRAAFANLKKDFPGYDGSGHELAGFVWYHGWNDGVNPKTAVPEYEQNLVNLIQDVRKEFNTPTLPVVIGELTGPWVNAPPDWERLRAAQAAAARHPALGGNVAFVPTRDFVRKPEESPNPSHGHHEFGNAETCFHVGDALGRAMRDLLAAGNRR